MPNINTVGDALESMLRPVSGSKDLRLCTFEHPIPSAVTRDALRDSDRSGATIRRILAKTDCVTILSKAEDEQLKKEGLNSSMPDGWCYDTGDPLARYQLVGIEIADRVEVHGTLVR
jgi:hypothetical protein